MHVHRSIPASMLAVLMAALLILLLAPTAALADSTVIVGRDTSAGENQPGWLFNRDQSTSTPFEFTTDEASIGSGSLYVQPIGTNPSDKFIAELFLLSPLEDLERISYDIGLGPESSDRTDDANEFYLNVYTNLPGTDINNFYDCRFDYVPTEVAADHWTTFTVMTDTAPNSFHSKDPACEATLAEMPEGSTVRAITLNLGDTGEAPAGVGTDAGLDGYFDNVVVTQDGTATTYDFETKDGCKKGGFEAYGYRNQGECVRALTSAAGGR